MPDPIELEWDAIEQLIPAGERRFARLALQVAEANVHAKANAVAEVLRAFAPTRNGDGDIVEKGDWKAAAWFLERRFPDEFGRTDKAYVEHTGAVASVAIDPADVGTVSKVLEAFREANVGIPAGDTEEEES